MRSRLQELFTRVAVGRVDVVVCGRPGSTRPNGRGLTASVSPPSPDDTWNLPGYCLMYVGEIGGAGDDNVIGGGGGGWDLQGGWTLWFDPRLN